MRAGKLDRTITIEHATETVAASGAVSSTWTPIGQPVRAEIVNQTANEFLAGHGEAERGTIVFRIRFIADITTADRIIFNGMAHDLEEIVEIGRRRGLELRAVSTR